MVDSKNKQSLFYHDIANQVHGLNLFFEQKLSKSTPISVEEIRILQQEVDVLKKLIDSQFKKEVTHDDSFATGERLCRCSDLVTHLCSTYFSHLSDIQIEGIECFERKAYVDYPIFHRVFTNLIKNIAEANPTKVFFRFSLEKGMIKIWCQNDFHYTERKDEEWKKGFGINSINTLLKEKKGHYHSFIEDEFWVSKVEIPILYKEVFEKIA